MRTDKGKGMGKEDDFSGRPAMFSAVVGFTLVLPLLSLLLLQQCQRQRQHGRNAGSHGVVVMTARARERRTFSSVLQLFILQHLAPFLSSDSTGAALVNPV